MFELIPFQRGIHVPKQLYNVENLFENFFREPFFPGNLQNTDLKVDIRENEKEYILEADLPGITKENLHLDFEDNVLTIAVEKDEQLNDEKENYICRERRSEYISRKFAFDNVASERIQAEYKDGVLKVSIPKSKVEEKKHQIEIQ
ncbi:Hsp20/alpha crystallin family protein [Desulfitobacterium sp. AusDCA]|uniref:Hsp20/alpha crystallin family protein n=1 Tax=Desulfitobacterium sp. AusDCA TaxID=3240383 RepID=UPI003DA6F849